jgi:hypothetical protein
MDSEQSQNFNERLSAWVTNQGFWFQLRYSMSGSGLKGRAMIHLLQLVFRALIFLLIVSVGVWVYLVKRPGTERFQDGLKDNIQSSLSAVDLEMRGAGRTQGQLEISRMAAEGEPFTFFSTMEAKSIRCQMGLVDGLLGVWNPGSISISRLDMDLRAGADDAGTAAKLSDTLFRKSSRVNIQSFEVTDTTLRWGYSERTSGAIENSTLKMQRTANGWRMTFRGGRFHQNWLGKLEIVDLVVACDPGGMVFEKAEMKQGQATVDFSGLRLVGGERPQLEGVVKVRNLVLEQVLPPTLLNFVEGSISGDFRVFGSTNSADGVGFEGQVVLDGKDSITLREQIHLLKALSVVDYARKYHRVDFREGSFQLKTTRGGLELSEVKLKAEELLTLDGKMSVRLPTQQEIQAATSKGGGLDSSPLYAGDDAKAAQPEASFTLKRAAQEAKRVKEGTQSAESLSLFDRLGVSIEMRRLQSQQAERMSRILRYEGNLRITLLGDAFERGRELQAHYPVDPATGRIPITVPIEGSIYDLTLKQAESIYQLGQR